MKLSKHTVRTIVSLIVIALGGLIFLQVKLLLNTIVLKEQTFKRNVFAAMNVASEKLEEIDARKRFFDTETSSIPQVRMKLQSWDTNRARRAKDSLIVFSVVTSGYGLTTKMDSNCVRYELDKPQRVTIKAFDVFGRLDTVIADGVKPKGSHRAYLSPSRFSNGVYFVQVKTDSLTTTLRWQQGKATVGYSVGDSKVQQGLVMKRVVETITSSTDIPLAERYSNDLVDSILAASLAAHAVKLPYEFGVAHLDSLPLARTTISPEQMMQSEFHIPLLRGEPFRAPDNLILHFPTYRSYMFGEFFPEFGSSLLLIGVIIFCFVYTIRTILRQKEFAGRLSEFINNMTHEFKTPISTIALASEAIARNDVARSKSKRNRYNGMIRDENLRMKNQVEKILQMAMLEEGDFELNVVPVDVHPLVLRAVDNIALQVTARKGSLATDLKAVHSVVLADAVHLENVIHNLLDNAVKYSKDAPVISVETSNVEGRLLLRVRDNGIGIAEEHIGKIFDKYFRVPTGNIHDVKGFGLGLSYVKLIMEAHHGTVEIRSRVGAGSVVELRLPCHSYDER
jgi:two-component system phosphate regulon sensor histidine kinase PhoR